MDVCTGETRVAEMIQGRPATWSLGYSPNTDYTVSSGCFGSPAVSGGKERQVSSVGHMRPGPPPLPASPCNAKEGEDVWCGGATLVPGLGGSCHGKCPAPVRTGSITV